MARIVPLDMPLADIYNGAADLIARHGLYEGDHWRGAHLEWEPTRGAIDVVASLGITLGLTNSLAIVNLVAAVDSDLTELHPSAYELLAYLDFEHPRELFDWSDEMAGIRNDEVVEVLRRLAADVADRELVTS